MITDETLRVTATFTTAKGTKLSQRSNVDLIIKDTSYGPQTYDVYIDATRGGANRTVEGQIVKGPTTLHQLMLEQHPNAQQKDGDTYNIRVASGINVIGSTTLPRYTPHLDEYILRGVDLSVTETLYQQLTGLLASGDGIDDQHMIYSHYLNHSDGQYQNHVFDKIIDLQGCYGTVRMFTWCLHQASANVRFILYNANGTVSSDTTLLTGSQSANTRPLTITKGMYGRLIYTYNKANSPDSKNDTFFLFKLAIINASSCPALMISKKYFNETHTINIYNNGRILGAGGDGVNYTPPQGSSDWWNRKISMVVVDAVPRAQAGGDAIQCTDVARLNIYNEGLISGGGAGGHLRTDNNRILYYTPMPGGAPLGRGGATWTAYNTSDSNRYVAPLKYSTAATLLNAGGANAGGLGKGSINPSNERYYDYPPGFYYRGRSSQVNYFGNGQYLGLQPNSTVIPY